MEKADILEMTVNHLRNVQRVQRQTEILHTHHVAASMPMDAPLVATNYRRGFNECAVEIGKYVHRVDGLDQGARSRLMNHLAGCTTTSRLASLQSMGAVTVPLVDATQLSSLPGCASPVAARPCFMAPPQCASLPTESARRTTPSPIHSPSLVATDTRNESSLLNNAIPLYINTTNFSPRSTEVTSPAFPTSNSPKVGADAPDVSPKFHMSMSPACGAHECAHELMQVDRPQSPVWRPWWTMNYTDNVCCSVICKYSLTTSIRRARFLGSCITILHSFLYVPVAHNKLFRIFRKTVVQSYFLAAVVCEKQHEFQCLPQFINVIVFAK